MNSIFLDEFLFHFQDQYSHNTEYDPSQAIQKLLLQFLFLQHLLLMKIFCYPAILRC